MEKVAEHTLPVYIFFFLIKLQMKRPSVLWSEDRIPDGVSGVQAERRKVVPWPESHISIDLNPQGLGAS